MSDEENIRRNLINQINKEAADRKPLEEQHGQVWNGEQLSKDFEVIGFLAPFVSVRRKTDGVKGTLMFQHQPRFYFSFEEDK